MRKGKSGIDHGLRQKSAVVGRGGFRYCVETRMPEISRFLGIVVSMYFDDHNPPHFHIRFSPLV